jgi:SAM-dependent methyltransferase
MSINYDHKLNPHRKDDGEIVVPILFADGVPRSVLDVGCGTGTWTRAVRDYGVADVLGIDGNPLPPEALISPSEFRLVDFTTPWNLGRRFDMALCLEVAEHLDERHARLFVECLTNHADTIVFSAACPGQGGQHHVNCQWPTYWQALFNTCGYACTDSVRPKIWTDQSIAPWYRQNVFVATRDRDHAGHEPRIHSLLHPQIFDLTQHCATIQDYQKLIESGTLPWRWYTTVPFTSLWAKVKRRLLAK